MVRKGKKDFTTGLDALIQKTGISDRDFQDDRDLQDYPKEVKAVKGTKEKERQMTFTIPVSLKRSIKKYCADNDITIKELFIDSVNRYMETDRDFQD